MDRLLKLDPARYGISVEQQGAYAALHSAFAVAYQTANEAETRSPANIQIKNSAKEALIAYIREIVPIIQAYPGTTDDDRAALEITIRDTEYTPIPVPSTMPRITILSTLGRVVHFKVNDVDETRRGKPPEVASAFIYRWIGADPPSDLSQWHFEGASTTAKQTLTVPADTPAGSQLAITALWVNSKMQPGPACTPVILNVAGGGVAAKAA